MRLTLLLTLMLFADPAALQLQTEPSAFVFWEGVQVGQANAEGEIRLSGIPFGVYELRVEKDGFQPRVLQVEVDAGIRTLNVRLQSVAARTPPPATVVPPGDVQPAVAPPQPESTTDSATPPASLPKPASEPAAAEVRSSPDQPVSKRSASPASETPVPPAEPGETALSGPAEVQSEASAEPGTLQRLLSQTEWLWVVIPLLVAVLLLAGWMYLTTESADSPNLLSQEDMERFSRTLSPLPKRRPKETDQKEEG